MAILPVSLARVSNLLQSSVARQSIDSTQNQLLQVENQLTTGKQVNTPSDDPSAASVIEQLNKTLARRQGYANNITAATSQLGETDSTLGDLTSLLRQASQIASANVGSDVTNSQRQSAAAIAQSLFQQAMSIANKQFNGMYLFGGDGGQKQPFIQNGAGVQYTGSGKTLSNTVDDGALLSFQANGSDVFGAVTTRVSGSANITPALTAQTRILDLNGAGNGGVALGQFQLSNGTVTKNVDVSGAQSAGDIVSVINQAAVGGITASISGQSIVLTGAASDNITVTEVGDGSTAGSLGIRTPLAGAGANTPVVGNSISPKVTALTPIASLLNGAGIDNSGLKITNGQAGKTISWPSSGKVEDLLNAINSAGLGVSANINASGTGIDILNATQGTSLTIGENGGSTATQLGVRSFSPTSYLSALNSGAGVKAAGGTTPDFIITRHDGSTFNVAIGSSVTVQDVISAINTADGGHGVTASFATTGNGIALTDATTGSAAFAVNPVNFSTAAADLGLTTAPSGNVITGTDVNPVKSAGVFGNLQALITALQSGDQAGITAAGQALSSDTDRVVTIRGQTGAVEQQLQTRQTSLDQENVATKSLLSQLQDTNFTDAITKFQTLQTALQASLQTTAKTLNLTLMNFLA